MCVGIGGRVFGVGRFGRRLFVAGRFVVGSVSFVFRFLWCWGWWRWEVSKFYVVEE